MTRIALLGCGPWGRLILRDLIELGVGVDVWSHGAESRVYASLHGAHRVYDNIDDLPVPDGFVISTNTTSHAAMIDAVAGVGVPIFVEKPLCVDPDDAKRFAEQLNGQLFVMDKWRYHAGVLALATVARSGDLGEVVGLRTTRVGFSKNHQDTDALMILAPHDLSIYREIVGAPPPVTSSYGFTDGNGRIRHANVTCWAESAPWHALEISTCSPIERREVAVVGTDGTAIMTGGYANHIAIQRDKGTEELTFAANMPLLEELSAFVNFLGDGPPPKSAVRESALIVQRLHEIRQTLNQR